MSDNHDEAATLFATKRKKAQEEEAKIAALKAEEQRMAELERQKQEVAEEIKRLESLQNAQKEQEEKIALAEQRAKEEEARAAARVAEAESKAAEAEAKAAEAEKAAKAAAKEAKAAKAAKESQAAKEAKAQKSAEKAPTDTKKILPFILIGVGVIGIALAFILFLPSGNKISKYFSIDASTRLFKMDTSLFGVTYDEFKKKVGVDDLMMPEEYPWMGHDMEAVYLVDEKESYACLFQKNKLVVVYRDSDSDKAGHMYDGAVEEFGKNTKEEEYWTGYPKYEWRLSDCYYLQFVEKYDGSGHYRQQYVSFDYDE